MNEIYKGKRAQISYVRSLRVFHHFGKFLNSAVKILWVFFTLGLCPFLLLLLLSFFPRLPLQGPFINTIKCNETDLVCICRCGCQIENAGELLHLWADPSGEKPSYAPHVASFGRVVLPGSYENHLLLWRVSEKIRRVASERGIDGRISR